MSDSGLSDTYLITHTHKYKYAHAHMYNIIVYGYTINHVVHGNNDGVNCEMYSSMQLESNVNTEY